ncbi:hypothetical protein EV284_4538 [Streptomyces sp. BK022]|uniref:hypothetical protein n=1 Tax=Streptomyces sp. BK022 TaxID=2512123 RepID=UPI0010293E48|nr:hypothetical protein [Streptomyces sp. BK022]RZU34936.1 hypothetical protein EV284_4538 [Streptomyces sp. BK022]
MNHFSYRPATPGQDPESRTRPLGPGSRPELPAALEAVNRDLAATLPEAGPMRLLWTPSDDEDIPDQYHAALPDGRWHGYTTDPAAGIAEAAQETVQAVLWQVWPLCPEHRTGVHSGVGAGERDVWWCRAGEGHELCAVGELARTLPGKQRRTLRRKERGREG